MAPTAEETRRGGVVRYRTIKLKDGRYFRVAVVRKPGPQGGRTVAGPIHEPKGADRGR